MAGTTPARGWVWWVGVGRGLLYIWGYLQQTGRDQILKIEESPTLFVWTSRVNPSADSRDRAVGKSSGEELAGRVLGFHRFLLR